MINKGCWVGEGELKKKPQDEFKVKISNEPTSGENPKMGEKDEKELNFGYNSFQFNKTSFTSNDGNKTKCVFVDTEDMLRNVISEDIRGCSCIGVDIEQHAYRCYQGLCCTLQLTTDNLGADYVLDCLSLRDAIPLLLGPVFYDPLKVKVIHGSKDDSKWLQRCFGIRIRNCFDTFVASTMLEILRSTPTSSPSASDSHDVNLPNEGEDNKLPELPEDNDEEGLVENAPLKHNLLSLLDRYGLLAGKDSCRSYEELCSSKDRLRVEDWRIRPLPEDMLNYASSDSRHLIPLMTLLTNDLLDVGGIDAVRAVLDESKRISTGRYFVKACPSSYKKDNNFRKGAKSYQLRMGITFSEMQEQQIAGLYRLRDSIARKFDEGVSYVFPKEMLFYIVEKNIRELGELAPIFGDVLPPLVISHWHDIQNALDKGKSVVIDRDKKKEIRNNPPKKRKWEEDGEDLHAKRRRLVKPIKLLTDWKDGMAATAVLTEICQATGVPTPVFSCQRIGPPHDAIHVVSYEMDQKHLNGTEPVTFSARSKKKKHASKECAEKVVRELETLGWVNLLKAPRKESSPQSLLPGLSSPFSDPKATLCHNFFIHQGPFAHPHYSVESSGKLLAGFTATVTIPFLEGSPSCSEFGTTKKEAEGNAAAHACSILQHRGCFVPLGMKKKDFERTSLQKRLELISSLPPQR